MFRSPCCFLSKNNYSEPHLQNRLYEASFLLQYLSKFHADQYYPATHINRTGVGNSSVRSDLLPLSPVFYLFLIPNIFLFSNIPVPHTHTA